MKLIIKNLHRVSSSFKILSLFTLILIVTLSCKNVKQKEYEISNRIFTDSLKIFELGINLRLNDYGLFDTSEIYECNFYGKRGFCSYLAQKDGLIPDKNSDFTIIENLRPHQILYISFENIHEMKYASVANTRQMAEKGIITRKAQGHGWVYPAFGGNRIIDGKGFSYLCFKEKVKKNDIDWTFTEIKAETFIDSVKVYFNFSSVDTIEGIEQRFMDMLESIELDVY